jgi:hypothetical protein
MARIATRHSTENSGSLECPAVLLLLRLGRAPSTPATTGMRERRRYVLTAQTLHAQVLTEIPVLC